MFFSDLRLLVSYFKIYFYTVIFEIPDILTLKRFFELQSFIVVIDV